MKGRRRGSFARWHDLGESTVAQATLPVANYLPVVAKQTYWKVPFERTRTLPPRDDPLPQDWSWLNGRTSPEPTRLIADVLTSSPGLEDRYAVEVLGAEEAARRTLALASCFRSSTTAAPSTALTRRRSTTWAFPPRIEAPVSDDCCFGTRPGCSSSTESGVSTATRRRITNR